jgi:GTPase involved in cell partitioning and DNA repair
MSSYKKPEVLLEELAQLDERLAKIQSFLRATKTGNIGDSLLTKANIEKAIHLLETINPEEKNMLQALKALIPLAEKNDQELAQKRTLPVPNKIPGVASEQTIWTSKLKTRMFPHKMI